MTLANKLEIPPKVWLVLLFVAAALLLWGASQHVDSVWIDLLTGRGFSFDTNGWTSPFTGVSN